MSLQRKLWVDVTDLSAWSGHLTGTQRVTFEVAQSYSKIDDIDLHFFVYDERSRAFYETAFQPILDRVLDAKKPTDSQLDSSKRPHRPSLKGVAAAQSIRVYRSLPYKLKRKFTPERKDKLKRAYRQISQIVQKHQQPELIKRATEEGPPITFGKNDIVVILGKPWDTMSFIDVLRTQKMANDFKIVHLIYDLAPSFLPHTFGYPLPLNYTVYLFEAISLADQLIAISESTKRDIIRFCKEEFLPIPPIAVVRLGDSLLPAPQRQDNVADLSPGSFILCVGTFEIRKNHILLYTAYREGVRRGLKLPKLVIVGGKGWYTQDVLHEFENDPLLKELVAVLHKTNDEDKSWLYHNCRFTIYPSVYEGWGLPIGESLAYGKACVASDTSSMTEVGGDLVDYFSPYDSGDCLEAIVRFMDDSALTKREREIRAGYNSVSWDSCARAVQRIVAKTADR